ncbi:MAG: gliding motility-associated ABC transporter substrate-binding protein GldG [Bacteroidales bacterium]|jgi:ABC-2 type transport system permease protein
MDKKKVKRQNILELALLLIVVILVNLVGYYLYYRFDLTQEQRFTVSNGTKTYLKELKDVVYVKVYLGDDNLPAGFRRLQKATRELLDEFKLYGKQNIEFEFVNPSESPDQKTRREVYDALAKDGLIYFNVQSVNSDGSKTQQVVFPAATVTYRQHGQEYERVVNFFQGNVTGSFNDASINKSIETLEYEFITGIRTVSRENTPTVGFIEGHGELDQYQVSRLARAIGDFYVVKRIEIGEKIDALDACQVIVIADPTTKYSEKDKFIIDQFIMRGGKVLWLVDAVKVNLAPLATSNETMGEINSAVNLGDIIYSYGARINSSLIQDFQCALMPVNAAPEGAEKPEWKLAYFPFFPLIQGRPDNPISRNINPVKFDFVSPIDTVGEDPKVRKSVILTSSDQSRVVRSPIRVSTDIFAEKPDPSKFSLQHLPVAVLMEGEFTSHYKNRLMADFINNPVFKVYDKSAVPSKMIVVADGDCARNGVTVKDGKYLTQPLGFDQATNTTFGNREFLLNCVNYLLDDSGVMDLRNREVKVRLLDRIKITKEKGFWQLFNVGLPVLLIIAMGLIYMIVRKRKYSK